MKLCASYAFFMFMLFCINAFSPYLHASTAPCSDSFKKAHIQSIPKAIQNEGNIVYHFPHFLLRNNAISKGDTLIAYSEFSNRRLFVELFKPASSISRSIFFPWAKHQRSLFFRSEIEISIYDKLIFNRIFESPSRRPKNLEEELEWIEDYIHNELGYPKKTRYEDLFMSELSASLALKSDRIFKRVENHTRRPSAVKIDFLDIVVHIAKSKNFLKKLQESINYLRLNEAEFNRFMENGFLDKTIDFDLHVFRIHNAKDVLHGLASSKNPEHKNLLKEIAKEISELNFFP